MNKLLIRSLSGGVYVGIIIACVLGGIASTIALASVLAVLGLIEFNRIVSKGNGVNPATLLMDLAGVLALVFSSCLDYALYLWVGIYILRCIEELYIYSEDPIRNLSMSLFGQLYLGVPLSFMPVVASQSEVAVSGLANPLLAVFLFIWLNDTGAFLVGCSIGRRPLFKRISPKKSWEGFLGGLFICECVSLLMSRYCAGFFGLSNNYMLWMLFALVVVLFSTWGDLLESLIKRTLGIKDSGNMIPGHGGILDRIDSLLLALPASALMLHFII